MRQVRRSHLHFMGTLMENAFVNAMWFNLVWLFAVVGQNPMLPATLALLLLPFLSIRDKSRELIHVAIITAIGVSVDLLLSLSGVFVFANTDFIPLWLIVLWVGFAATVSRSLFFLASRPIIAALVGAVSGPLSYLAGYRFEAVEFSLSVINTMLLLGCIWAILLPMFLAMTSDMSRANRSSASVV